MEFDKDKVQAFMEVSTRFEALLGEYSDSPQDKLELLEYLVALVLDTTITAIHGNRKMDQVDESLEKIRTQIELVEGLTNGDFDLDRVFRTL